MKNLVFVLGVFFVCISCDKTNEEIVLTSGKWKLIKMTGSFVNSTTVGDEMAWQEYIIFNEDATFIKSRTLDGTTIEAFGTYKELNNDKDAFLELQYSSGSELKASCGHSETLLINGKNLLVGSWNICDGPSLEYQQINK